MSDAGNPKIRDLYSLNAGKRLIDIPEGAYFICPIGPKYSAVGLFDQSQLIIGVLKIGENEFGVTTKTLRDDYKTLRLVGVLPAEDANVSYINKVLHDGKGNFLRIANLPDGIGIKWSKERKKEYYDRVMKHMNEKFKERNGFSLDSIMVVEGKEEYYKNKNQGE
ncbi:MAG: hypothetical protein GXO64_01365 [Candidatus Micrarchaeota archaeon]|nr:hypothetical protein [Candidatus Micrarchaeota archaeon]